MTTYRSRRRISPGMLVAVAVGALVFGGAAGALIVAFGKTGGAPTHAGASHPPSTASSGRGAAVTTTTTPPPALTIASISPATGTRGVSSTAPISVTFSAPLAQNTPLPTIAPPASGAWQVQGNVLAFTPSAPFPPLAEVAVTLPGGESGVKAASGAVLGQGTVDSFRVEDGSVLRLQQLLSALDYSPLRWTSTQAAISPNDNAGQLAALFNPPAGSFSWIHRGWPRELRRLWAPGTYSLFTKGLVMSFQADHGLTPNGRVTPALWTALLSAVASGSANSGGYDYALANKAGSESFTIWHDGHVVVRSRANTGIAASPTPDGNFAVYTRLRRQVMRGTNPDGSHYADLVQYIAYFNGNDAVHYMDRADYGIPQSLGCVELPLADAARAWPYLAYGTLITVEH